MIGYAEGATSGKDRLFDAVTSAGLTMKIFSLLNNDMMAIQGKSYPIDVNDRVDLGLNLITSGNYSIAIAALDNVDSYLPIYLEDKNLNVIHDLRQAPYTFMASAGQTNNRFTLRYTNQVLNSSSFTNNDDIAVISNDVIKVESSSKTISNVKIYNVLGQLLLDSNTLNSNTFETAKIQKNNTALLVQVTLENGSQVTKKIIY